MKSRIQFWDKIASQYDRFMRNNDNLYNNACDVIKKHLFQNSSVLELACGTGQFSFRLFEYVQNYTATDFSPKMIQHCISKKQKDSFNFQVADASNLNYDNNSFDVVIIANSLHCVPNANLILKEAKRVLKKGGLLIAPTFVMDIKPSSIKMCFINLMGFKTYNKWSSGEFSQFVQDNGFSVLECNNITTKAMAECVLVAVNK